MIASYGMPVGWTVFETCLFIGQILYVAENCENIARVDLITRNDVKNMICHSSKAKDSNITMAIKGRYPATGGGKDPYKGTKDQPGPLYGFANDMWQALALAHAYLDNGCRGTYELGKPK